MHKLTNILVLCLFSIAIASCGGNLPNGLMVASDICASQKHNECHYEYDSYEDSYQPPLQLKQEEPEIINTNKIVKITETTNNSKTEEKHTKPVQDSKTNNKQKSTTIKERYKISVEINDIATERAINKIKNLDKIDNNFKTEKSQDNNFKKITETQNITKNEDSNNKNLNKTYDENISLVKTVNDENVNNYNLKKGEIINNQINIKSDIIEQKHTKKINSKIEKSKLKSDFFLEEVRYTDLPEFSTKNIKPAFEEFLKSCIQHSKDNSKWIKSNQIAINRNHILEICQDGEKIKSELHKYQESEKNKVLYGFFIRWFSPYKVFSHGKDTGTFTGYYEAHIKGSTKATCDYLYPIYGLPDNPEHQKFTREEINDGALRGKTKILFWAKNPVDIYFTQIQGSGVVETEDKKQYRIGYAGNNGYSFTGTGETIKKMGLRPEKGLSMTSIRDYLNKNPETAKKIMNANKRFIFFKENKQNGAVGTFGTTLTAKQTIAVDQSYIPLGLPVFIDVKDPDDKPLNRIVITSDTGIAIKGGIRADFFFGFGEDALKQAGRMKQIGKYFILLPKNQDEFMVKSDNIHCLD